MPAKPASALTPAQPMTLASTTANPNALTPAQLRDPKMTKPIIVASALLVFSKKLSMSCPKPSLVAAYHSFLTGAATPTLPGKAPIPACNPTHCNAITSEWTICC